VSRSDRQAVFGDAEKRYLLPRQVLAVSLLKGSLAKNLSALLLIRIFILANGRNSLLSKGRQGFVFSLFGKGNTSAAGGR